MKKLFYSLLICLIFLLSFEKVCIAVSQDDVTEKQGDLENIQEEIEETEGKLNSVKQKQLSVIDNLQELERELAQKEAEETEMAEKIVNTQNEIEITAEKLALQEQKARVQEDEMKERLTIIYMNGNASYLELLFQADTLQGLHERIEMVKNVVSFDNDVLDELQRIRDEIETTKLEQEALKKDCESQKAVIAQQRDEIAKKKKEAELLKQELEDQQEQYEDELDHLEKDSKAIENEIKRLQELLKNTNKYGGGIMAWPVPGFYRVTSDYGYRTHPIYGVQKMHTGIDIGSNYDASGNKVSIYGQSFVAASDGTVILSQYYGGYGECVIVDHGGGVMTLYAHASKRLVSVGQTVSRGQPVSLVGSTGASTGAHAHFEVRENGVPVSPWKYLQ